jgi:hypothetical protein
MQPSHEDDVKGGNSYGMELRERGNSYGMELRERGNSYGMERGMSAMPWNKVAV